MTGSSKSLQMYHVLEETQNPVMRFGAQRRIQLQKRIVGGCRISPTWFILVMQIVLRAAENVIENITAQSQEHV